MFPSYIFVANPPSQYQQTLKTLIKNNRFQHNFKENHNKQLIQLKSNQKYIDSPLTQSSISEINKIKNQLNKLQSFNTVVVSPLRKCLQTGYQLFKNQKSQILNNTNKNKVNFYIQPLLADRLDATQSIGDLSQSKYPTEYEKYNQFYQSFAIKMKKSQWVYDILPQRVIKQLPNNIGLTSGLQYVKLLKLTSQNTDLQEKYCLQTKIEFAQRIQHLKESLSNYRQISGSGKKILVIASAQVLSYLGATDFHQNGQPVNSLRLQSGEVHLVNLVINGLEQIQQLDFQGILPFCR